MSTRATEAESVLKEHMGYLPVSEMERRGVSRTEISRFVREAKLEKAAKGLYVSPNAESDPLFELQYRYPKAIFSHETALFLLGEGERAPLTPTQLQVEPGQADSIVSFMKTRFFMVPAMPLAQPMQNWKCRGAFKTPFFR